MSELPFPLRAVLPTLGPRVVTAELDGRTIVRSPTRPDHHDGHGLWLHEPLTVAGLDRVLGEWHDRFGAIPGVEERQIRWVEDTDRDRGTLEAALRDRSTATTWSTHLELGGDLVGAPSDVAGLELRHPTDPRHWHGVAVQYRHAGWGDDDGFWTWWVDGLRVLNEQGRALTLGAVRRGVPVGAATAHFDPEPDVGPGRAGLAVLDDVMVHPAHRGQGIASTLVHTLVARLLDDKPRARVVVRAEEARGLYERLGFVATATLGCASSHHP